MSPCARLTFHHPVVYPRLNGISIPPFPPGANLQAAFLNSSSPDLAINWKLFPDHPSQTQLWSDYLAGGGVAERAEVDIIGAFSLEPLVQEGDTDGVGIRVDGHVVVVSRGTKVFRGLGMGAGGKEGRSLWWRGTMMNGGKEGIWTLGLISASEGDLLSIHRLLVFLPLCFPPPPNPPQQRPNRPRVPTDYRNSLLMIDDDTHEVLSVLSLPLPPSTPPPISQSQSHDNSAAHRDGIALAAQVDRITLGISPGPYGHSPHSHRTKEEQEEGEESDRVDDSPRGLERREADGRYQVASVPARDGSESTIKGGGTQVFVSPDKQQHGFDMLDAVMGDMSPFPLPPARAPSDSSPIVPSLSTHPSSRPLSTTSTIFTHSFEATVSAYETALDLASARSSTFLNNWPSPPLLPSTLPHFPPSDLDLNSSNAVLLEFLAGPSVLHVTPVSNEAVSRRGLVPATIAGAWSWLDVLSLGLLRGNGEWIGTGMLGGWDLSRLWRSQNEDARPSTTLRRKVSVLWVDGEGRGNRAFLRGAAGAPERTRGA